MRSLARSPPQGDAEQEEEIAFDALGTPLHTLFNPYGEWTLPVDTYLPLRNWLFTPESQWQSRGVWRILQGWQRLLARSLARSLGVSRGGGQPHSASQAGQEEVVGARELRDSECSSGGCFTWCRHR